MARTLDDPELLIRALIANGVVTAYDPDLSQPYFAEANVLAKGQDDPWIWSQLYIEEARSAMGAGDPPGCERAAAKALEVATAIGNHATVRAAHWAYGWARGYQGDFLCALSELGKAIDQAAAAHDTMLQLYCLLAQGFLRAHLGDAGGARASADSALETAADLMEFFAAPAYATVAVACQAAGNGRGAQSAYEKARGQAYVNPMMVAGVFGWCALAPLAAGDVELAREWADDTVDQTYGCYRMVSLTSRAQVMMASGDVEAADRDARAAFTAAAATGARYDVSSILELLARVAAVADNHHEAARLFGAAEAMRQRTGEVRLPNFDAVYRAAVDNVRAAMGTDEFDEAWAQGASMSTDEAIAYMQRGRGERKRPSSGWASLTPTELDVVRLLTEGLPNKDIATRLFISPRTVETHLTHVYAKLGMSSRVQLAQEATRHA
jgi:DNA-binding CsgD family transcriptional regulator